MHLEKMIDVLQTQHLLKTPESPVVAGVMVLLSEIGRDKHAVMLKLPHQPPARSGVRVVTVVPPYSRENWSHGRP